MFVGTRVGVGGLRGAVPSPTPKHGYFVLSPVTLASRDQYGGPLTVYSPVYSPDDVNYRPQRSEGNCGRQRPEGRQ